MVRIRPRLTYANVMATVAVFVSLGGSSYAAVKLSKNSVRSDHIRNGQVKRADLASNAVTSDKVRNGSLRAADFRTGDLPAGATGQTGAQGAKGDTGTVDTSNFYDKAASDARFLGSGATAANAAKVDGKDAGELMTTGATSEISGFSIGDGTVVERTITVEVGPGSRQVLILATADVWALAEGSCDGFMAIEVDGTRLETADASATAPDVAAGDGKANLATSTMPTLAAGSHTIDLVSLTEGSCPGGLMTARLHAVVLSG